MHKLFHTCFGCNQMLSNGMCPNIYCKIRLFVSVDNEDYSFYTNDFYIFVYVNRYITCVKSGSPQIKLHFPYSVLDLNKLDELNQRCLNLLTFS